MSRGRGGGKGPRDLSPEGERPSEARKPSRSLDGRSARGLVDPTAELEHVLAHDSDLVRLPLGPSGPRSRGHSVVAPAMSGAVSSPDGRGSRTLSRPLFHPASSA